MSRLRECKGCSGPIFESANAQTAEWLHVHRSDADRCTLEEAAPKK